MPSPREQLLTILATKSFRLGDFQLSSGGHSDYYVDCRTTTLDALGALLTARVVLDEIRKRGWAPEAVGGMTLGADPIVTAVAMLSAQEGQPRAEAQRDRRRAFVHGFLVRKAEKAHGTGRRIEGFQRPGARAVIVDDVCTTGASTVQAIEAARAGGFDVIGVLCLVEREEAGGRPAVEKAAAPASFISVFKSSEVRQAHLQLQRETGGAAL
jgi:orotate phosphoribosyltransferase